MKKEYWKLIKDYENYMVSSFGRVKNIKSNRILKLYKDKRKESNNIFVNGIKINERIFNPLIYNYLTPANTLTC